MVVEDSGQDRNSSKGDTEVEQDRYKNGPTKRFERTMEKKKHYPTMLISTSENPVEINFVEASI